MPTRRARHAATATPRVRGALDQLRIVHYDHDCDILAEHTLLAFGSVWAAPCGSAG